MRDVLKAQKEKASGKSLDLSKAFISSVLYIFSWGGLYQNAVLHIRIVDEVGIAALLRVGFEVSFLESGLSRGDYPNYIFFECVNYPLSICSDGRQ